MSIGIDIEDISRFKNKSQEFFDIIYTKNEQQNCHLMQNSEKHFASIFCAKEATIKALNALNIEHPPLNQIEIYLDNKQQFQIRLLNNNDTIMDFQVSLTTDSTKAMAIVRIIN